MTTARYTFTQFITSLEESLKLQDAIVREKSIDTLYGQYRTHPHNVCYRGSAGTRESETRTPRRYASRRRDYTYTRSLSRDRGQNDPGRPIHKNSRYERHRGASGYQSRRLRYGCGSPHHILSDNKYAPSLNSIKTHVMAEMNCNEDTAANLTEQIFNLQVFETADNSNGQRENEDYRVISQSEETLCVAEEEEKLK